MHHVRVNLPHTIFNYLKGLIVVSRNNHQSLIPFGKVLSAPFYQAGVVGEVHYSRPRDALEEEINEVIECCVVSLLLKWL